MWLNSDVFEFRRNVGSFKFVRYTVNTIIVSEESGLRLLSTFIFLFILMSANADFAEVEKLSGSSEIQALSLDSETYEVSWLNPSSRTDGARTPGIEVTGKFELKDATLLYDGNSRVIINDDLHFKVRVPLHRVTTELRFTIIDAYGNRTTNVYTVRFTTYNAFMSGVVDANGSRKFFASMGVGVTSLSYSDPRIGKYSATDLSAKLAVNYSWKPSWDAGISAYGTLMPISQTTSDDARFYGLNLRVGYVLTKPQNPWRVAVHGGTYFTTMFVKTNRFGYQNISGPQIFPSVQRTLDNGNAIAVYLKFSPISSNFSLLNFDNREIGAGGAFHFRTGVFESWSITADYANVQVFIQTLKATSHSYTLGVAHSF